MLVLLFCLVLTACSSAPSYDSQLQGWVGMSQEALMEEWGEPNTMFNMGDGVQEITYVQLNNQGMSNSSDTYAEQMDYQAMATPTFLGPNPDAQNVSYCKISFVVQNNLITNYNFNGDDCVGQINIANNAR